MTDREIFEKETGNKAPVLGSFDDSTYEYVHTKYDNELIVYLQAYVLWLEKRSEWVSVEDRLPTERCLVYTDTDDKTIEYRIIPKGLIKTANDATHWFPLPTPPDEAKRGRG